MNEGEQSDAESTPGPEPRRLKLPFEDWREAVRKALDGEDSENVIGSDDDEETDEG